MNTSMNTDMTIGGCLLAMQGKRVVVAGDVMLDAFVHGDIKRISPEAPVPVLARSHTRYMPGGAANVARNLAHMGIAVELIGVIGADAAGERLAACLAEEVGITPRLIIDKTRPTTEKTRYTTAQQQILRVDVEETHPLDAATHKGMAEAVGEAMAGQATHGFIFSDYNKGVLSRPLIESVTAQNKQGMPILADPKQWESTLFRGVDILTPNLAELTALCHSMGYTLAENDITAINQAAKGLSQHAKIKHIITTLSAEGLLLSDEGDGVHITSQAKSVYDVSGAGDTVIAHMAAALTGGAGLGLAAKLANCAATIVVSKAGTASVVPGELLGELLSELRGELRGELLGNSNAPIYDFATAQKACEEWQAKGETIVLTNGCFDCLHSGHLWLLAEAAKKGRRLLVAINSDASARRLKGEGRPIQSQNLRAAIIAHLPMVAGVVIFDEDTPQRLITALTPDVLVKGGDYQAKDVIGGAHVAKHGGRVEIIPTKEGFSTTRLVAS